ncbi:TadE family protein [Paenibacillus sp. YPG26]|uniref:TadE/TadG family type IV pilus assembly protein n=1 Tax=Paenibacillus sp. YPG26 TaxID=2878915 RepID=UPI00203CBED1|nr:TadE family protein [Paenibacillus sp. YPG26]USB34112.1 pilus assembly protein [Paenibacillus sp. YPG26]
MPLKKRIIPTKGWRNVRGSIVLEASLVLPVFLLFIFFLIYMVQMTVISTQMHTVVSNAVRQVSASIYPVALAVQSRQDKGGEGSVTLQMPKASLSEWAAKYTSQMQPPFSDWVKEAAAKGDEPLQDLKNQLSEALLDPVMKPLLHPFMEGINLDEDRLHVSRVVVPDLKTGKNPYFGLEISYELPIKVPFTSDKIVLQSKAVERLWIGDTHEQSTDSAAEEGTDKNGQAAVVLSKPDPAYTGNQARIQARAAPGSKVTLTVYYKSGRSVAKYLGEAVADSSGNVEWEWLISGNTTHGNWTFVLETEEGMRTTDSFQVAGKGSKK